MTVEDSLRLQRWQGTVLCLQSVLKLYWVSLDSGFFIKIFGEVCLFPGITEIPAFISTWLWLKNEGLLVLSTSQLTALTEKLIGAGKQNQSPSEVNFVESLKWMALLFITFHSLGMILNSTLKRLNFGLILQQRAQPNWKTWVTWTDREMLPFGHQLGYRGTIRPEVGHRKLKVFTFASAVIMAVMSSFTKHGKSVVTSIQASRF